MLVDFEEVAVVDHGMDHIEHVVRLIGRGRHDRIEHAVLAVG